MDYRDGSWYPSPFPAVSGLGIVKEDFIPIPCGQCLGCRMAYSRLWADRLSLESLYYDEDSSWFITLTYDDDHLIEGEHRRYYADPETGEAKNCLSLQKKDLQDFMKRVRYYYPESRISFFGCGEYGSQHFRPHLHLILFGVRFDRNRFEVWSKSPSGFTVWRSPELDKCWQYRGIAVLGQFSYETAAYVARYCTKKVGSNSKEYSEKFNIEPEFVLMSRNPAIGKRFYEDHQELVESGNPIFIPGRDGAHKIFSVRYFDKLLELDNKPALLEVKDRRRIAAQAQMESMENSFPDMTYLEILDRKLENFYPRFKRLKREL